MTKERVVEVIVDEARATVDRIAEVDRRPLPAAVRTEMLLRVRDIARRDAFSLRDCTEPQLREAVERHIRKQVADLRPS